MVRERASRSHFQQPSALRILLLLTAVAFWASVGLADSQDKVIILPAASETEVGDAGTPSAAATVDQPADVDEATKAERERQLVTMSIKQAFGHLENGRNAEAKAAMEWVLSVDPANAEAKRILADATKALSHQKVAVDLNDGIDDLMKQNRLEMEYRYVEANRLIAENKYAEAIPKLEMAIAIGKTVPGSSKILGEATTLLEKAKAHQHAQMTEEAIHARKEAEKIVKLFEQKQREREHEKAKGFFDNAKKDYELREFKPALDNINKVIAIDENYPGAKFLKGKIETDGKEAIATAVEEEKRLSHDRLIAQTYEDAIPTTALITYPDNPRKHSTDTVALDASDTKSSPAMDSILGGLKKRISCNFIDAPLAEAVKHLRDVCGCNIVIDPRCAIQKDGVAGLSVSDTEMVNVLNMICRMNRIHWYVKDEMIIISDRDPSEESTMRVYDITDLCAEAKSFGAGDYDALASGVKADRAKRANGQGTAEERDRRGKEWADLIRDSIEPLSWGYEKDGKGANTIQYRGGKLVISHNAEVHEKIVKLLDDFRKARALQVSIQTRFIDINKDFLERVGIDWTGLDNLVTQGISGKSQKAGGASIPAGGVYKGSERTDEFGIPVTQAPWYRLDPTVIDGEFGPTRGTPFEPPLPASDTSGRRPYPTIQDASNLLPGYLDLRGANRNLNTVSFPDRLQAWNAYGGMSLDIAFLNRYQLRALIEAVRKDKKGTVLTSPRVTCFNGQRANVVVARLVNYLQTFDEDGTPTIATVTDGVVLEVKPYVSADQRYVTLELLPSITELRQLMPVRISRMFDTPGNIPVYGYTIIELPEVFTRAVETTVSVPDGGTILIGGLSTAQETEGFATVPLLSKIPIIKYLFMSWGKMDTRQSLVVLVTADILVQTELEQKMASND